MKEIRPIKQSRTEDTHMKKQSLILKFLGGVLFQLRLKITKKKKIISV